MGGALCACSGLGSGSLCEWVCAVGECCAEHAEIVQLIGFVAGLVLLIRVLGSDSGVVLVHLLALR